MAHLCRHYHDNPIDICASASGWLVALKGAVHADECERGMLIAKKFRC